MTEKPAPSVDLETTMEEILRPASHPVAPAWQGAARCVLVPATVLAAAWTTDAALSLLPVGEGVHPLAVVLGVLTTAAVGARIGGGGARQLAAVLGGVAAGFVPWVVDLPWALGSPLTALLLPVMVGTAALACAQRPD